MTNENEGIGRRPDLLPGRMEEIVEAAPLDERNREPKEPQTARRALCGKDLVQGHGAPLAYLGQKKISALRRNRDIPCCK
jgi:hypothetical protein